MQLRQATPRGETPGMLALRAIADSANNFNPFLVNGKEVKHTQRSISKAPANVLQLILGDMKEGAVITTDLERLEKESEVN